MLCLLFFCAFLSVMNCVFFCAQENQHFFGKNETQAAWPRQPSGQRPSKCLTPFPFSNLLSKRISQEWAHARSGNVKKCNYISHDVYWGPQQLLLEARLCNAYNLKLTMVGPFDCGISVSQVCCDQYRKDSHHIISPSRYNTFHHHTIPLPLLLGIQILRLTLSCQLSYFSELSNHQRRSTPTSILWYWLVDDRFSKHALMVPTTWRNTNGCSLKWF